MMKQLRLSKVKSPIQGRSANLPQNENFNSSLMIQKPGNEAAAVTDKARGGGRLGGSRGKQMCRPSRDPAGKQDQRALLRQRGQTCCRLRLHRRDGQHPAGEGGGGQRVRGAKNII